jgi:hypothetical protein
VTVCGMRRAASMTSLKRFFASCTDQLRSAMPWSYLARISS